MNWRKLLITVFRVAIGWHFLYEGVSKLAVGSWSAASYLSNSTGPFSWFYQWLGNSEVLMNIVDPANVIGLILCIFALFQIKKNNLKGKWLAIIGIILFVIKVFLIFLSVIALQSVHNNLAT